MQVYPHPEAPHATNGSRASPPPAPTTREQLRASAVHPESQASHPLPIVESTALLQGRQSIGIEHNGALYRLQTTRLGKLILTK